MNIEPQSPMKMDAGFELYTRNPSSPAPKTASIRASAA